MCEETHRLDQTSRYWKRLTWCCRAGQNDNFQHLQIGGQRPRAHLHYIHTLEGTFHQHCQLKSCSSFYMPFCIPIIAFTGLEEWIRREFRIPIIDLGSPYYSTLLILTEWAVHKYPIRAGWKVGRIVIITGTTFDNWLAKNVRVFFLQNRI